MSPLVELLYFPNSLAKRRGFSIILSCNGNTSLFNRRNKEHNRLALTRLITNSKTEASRGLDMTTFGTWKLKLSRMVTDFVALFHMQIKVHSALRFEEWYGLNKSNLFNAGHCWIHVVWKGELCRVGGWTNCCRDYMIESTILPDLFLLFFILLNELRFLISKKVHSLLTWNLCFVHHLWKCNSCLMIFPWVEFIVRHCLCQVHALLLGLWASIALSVFWQYLQEWGERSRICSNSLWGAIL